VRHVWVLVQDTQRRRTRRKHERDLKYERCAKDLAAMGQWSEFVDHLGNQAWYNYTSQETVYSRYTFHAVGCAVFASAVRCWFP
jgi:hypothetical protein